MTGRKRMTLETTVAAAIASPQFYLAPRPGEDGARWAARAVIVRLRDRFLAEAREHGYGPATITAILQLLDDDEPDDEPVPAAAQHPPPEVMAAYREHVGGYCTCSGNVTHDGTFHAVVTA